MTEAYHTNSTGGASCDDEGAAAALGIAKWLCLAATPTFAIMALMTGVLECLPFGALAEADLQAVKRCPPVLIRRSPDRAVANIPRP
jgi:hypothetical protein